MTEKFTNIAGGPFQDYVSKQIDIRKQFLNESHNLRTNDHLIYSNNRNGWIRLTSGTDVTLNHPLSKKYNLSGADLAKKFILQGGTVSAINDGNNYSLKNHGGFGEGKQYGNIGTNTQGFKPLPGITSIDLSSAGKLGTLQYANINFICYDIEQLEIYEALFMKLGFSMILEWGHTYYLDNSTSKLKQPIPLNPFDYKSKEDLIKAIQQKRVSHSGNYDAMYGVISNFGWKFNSDGTYSCELKLVGAGDILESLKINQSVGKTTNFLQSSKFSEIESDYAGLDEEEVKSLPSVVGDRDLSLLNRALFDMRQVIIEQSFKVNGVGSIGIVSKTYRDLLNNIYSNCPYDFIQIGENGEINGDINSTKGNHYSILNGLEEDPDNIPTLSPTLFNGFTVNYNISDSTVVDPSTTQEQTYITLGNLLSILTATGMIYDSSTPDKGKPYIYMDFNDSLNYCYTFKGQMSIDPTICLIPRNQSNLEDLFGLGEIIEDKIYNQLNGISVELGSTVSTEINTNIKKNLYLSTTDNQIRAKMMHILVNINHITDILREMRNSNDKGNVNYSDFLNQILQNISKATGGFNEFRLLVDDSSKSVRIIDDNKTLSKDESNDDLKYTEIPIFGMNSMVYDFDFKSKISPKMASMVTIAAQAEPSTLGEDSFAITNLSRGLEDRYMKYKYTSEVKKEDELNTVKEETLKTFKTHISNIYQGDGGEFTINRELLEPSYNIYRELMANYKILKEPNNKGTILIPLDFSLTMDGLSGIIPNSAFTIPTNLIPSTYKTKSGKSKIAFILHTINQNFDNNKWTTKITGQTINIRFDDEDILKEPNNQFSQNSLLSTLTNPQLFTPIISPSCTRRASLFFTPSTINIPINYLKEAANKVGLISPQSIASLIAIASGETGLNPRSEDHIYRSESSLRVAFPNLSKSQAKRALRRGISKKEFFSIVYGEYSPGRVGNRNISDGGLYYGRGYIQLTGYGNYLRYNNMYNKIYPNDKIDIIKNPDLVNHSIYGARISAIYFKDRVKVDQFNQNYFQLALRRVGNNVGDSYSKKTEYYNCYIKRL